ncbi:beta-lactamase-like protein [Hyaloraphidium curvatum]|nr:beta-lactamase-like protein [Hyaloraphidium curvatum]
MAPPDTSLRVTLLGTGSPTASLARSHPAALVEWGPRGSGHCALVDCGDGTVQQLLKAGVKLSTVTIIGLTHMHWDHILGYPAFVWGSWLAGRPKLRTYGPTGTEEMHQRLVRSYYADQAEWGIDLGFRKEGWEDIKVLDVEDGWTADLDGGCTVRAGRVEHPPMASLGYRFEHGGKSIVISGDVARCDELVRLSRDADVLVVDACAAPPPDTAPPQRQKLIEKLHGFHASPQDCVDMARAAGVKHVVLTHHLPEVGVPSFDAEGYEGKVTVGEDLMVVEA